MLVSVAEVRAEMNDLFNGRARHNAKETGFCRREREITGPVFAKTLVLGLMLEPDSALEDFQDFASEHQGVFVTAKAFAEPSAGFLEALLGERGDRIAYA